MIEQQFTPEQFTSFAFGQLRKAADEDETVAKIRIIALSQSIDIAKASFEQSTTAKIPVIEAATQTDETMSHQQALGSERGGAVSNPEDLGTDLTKALDALTKSLTPDDDKKPADKKPEKVVKGMGDPNKSFEELDDMRWARDMSVGDETPDWGPDPE